ncbi:MAG: transcriptional activator RfaH [Deltaproteobacteria bacterium]|nr:transcriptional activator RfaH [Deltaproteobacteria bacterium]
MNSVEAMQWYVVRTKPREEERVVWYLSNAGIETFYSKVRQMKRIRGRREEGIGPLFPGYLFARFNIESDFRTVRYTRGVRKVVAFGPWPEPVNPEIVNTLKMRMQDGPACAGRYVTIEERPLRPHEPVKIQEGPLEGLQAIFERPMNGGERVVLLLQTLSYQARVVVDRGKVSAC